MTLAWIFAVGIFYTAPYSLPGVAALNSVEQSQAAPAPAQNPPGSPAQTSPPPQKTSEKSPSPTPKLRHHKKKTLSSDCASNAASSPASNNSTASLGPNTPPSNCPPAKVVVHNGGSSEPSIQLTGDAPHQSDTANQLLGQTEENLKKINALQLTSSQQEMVNQIHQFMDQSKAAVAAGDSERARTLALKAQMLSEELVKPPK